MERKFKDHLQKMLACPCLSGTGGLSRAIEDVIRGSKGFGDEYRIIITREKTMDELIVQAEYAKGVDTEIVIQLKGKLEAALRARGLRAVVQIVEPDHLQRTEFKGKRVIDKRSLYDEMTKHTP